MSIIYLKVKIKSLAAEAKIIRYEEAKYPRGTRHAGGLHDNLQAHRRFVVRPEARAAQLAYGYLRGRAYAQIERPNSEQWALARTLGRAVALINKYGPRGTKITVEMVRDWVEGVASMQKAA